MPPFCGSTSAPSQVLLNRRNNAIRRRLPGHLGIVSQPIPNIQRHPDTHTPCKCRFRRPCAFCGVVPCSLLQVAPSSHCVVRHMITRKQRECKRANAKILEIWPLRAFLREGIRESPSRTHEKRSQRPSEGQERKKPPPLRTRPRASPSPPFSARRLRAIRCGRRRSALRSSMC